MPALDWIKRAQTRANKDPDFRRLGSMNASVCFKSGNYACSVVFSAFEVKSINPIDLDLIAEQDIVIDMKTREWNSYLYNRRLKRAPNLLELDSTKAVIRTKNAVARLDFERIVNSIQKFVDYGAKSRA